MLRPEAEEIEDGKERSGACLASMAGAATWKTWGSRGAAKAMPKEKKDIGGRLSAPKGENVLVGPWEEREQKRATWNVDGALYRGPGCAAAKAGWRSCSWADCCGCCCWDEK